MTTNEKFANEVMVGFQKNKGRGTVYCINPIKPYILIAKSVISFTIKHPTKTILVLIDKLDEKKIIENTIRQFNINNVEVDVRYLTILYYNPKYRYAYDFIIASCSKFLTTPIINKIKEESLFTLCIFTDYIRNQEIFNEITKILPYIYVQTNVNDAKRDLIYMPVKEYHIGVDLSDEDIEKYKKYTEYINNCISIFGDLGNIEKCKNGDIALNISSTEFRFMIAKQNGWNEHLDTNIELFKQIDDIYNPNVLYEKACNFYNIAGERRNLLTDNNAKLEVIKNLCEKHKDKQIIILSKRGEFAAQITEYINSNLDIRCGDFHDCIEDVMLVDDFGFPILHKKGALKGKPRILKARAISTRNLNAYNAGVINILSIKYSSKSDMSCNVDIMIFADSLNEDIINVRNRFSNIYFKENPTIIYKLYCKHTIEEKKLKTATVYKNVTVIEEEENNIEYNEENNSIIL